MRTTRTIATDRLDVAYVEGGQPSGWPVVLLHGFPYDVHAYDEVTPVLAAAGARVVVPWLRGFGPTRFRSPTTMRSGEQGALAADLLALLDALEIGSAVLAGYDWGGRAACAVAALRPERVRGLVTGQGYNLHTAAARSRPSSPQAEHRHWYQYLFHNERGRALLERDRDALCRYLWHLWSPTWTFTDATFARTAPSFANPDFVDVVLHSYRVRYGLVEGDPAYADLEAALATGPDIGVPTVVLDAADDGVTLVDAADKVRFTGPYEYRLLPGAGHDTPQEAPDAVAAAVLRVAELAG